MSRAVNGSGYGDYKNPSQYLDGLSRDNPAAWFNLSANFAAIDPPSKSASSAEIISIHICAILCLHLC